MQPEPAGRASRQHDSTSDAYRSAEIAKENELSTREKEVLQIYLEGTDVSEIARSLYISPHTVRNHVKSIFRKLNVHSRRELMSLFIAVESPRPSGE